MFGSGNSLSKYGATANFQRLTESDALQRIVSHPHVYEGKAFDVQRSSFQYSMMNIVSPLSDH